MEEIIKLLNDLIWSNVFIALCLIAGLFFSIRTKFVQVRFFRHMIKLLFTEGSSDKGVSPFQAFSIAIAGRVGVGNIVGVATAIAAGGPGAIFWMWMIAFLGSASAFIESTLAQIYKVEKNGQYCGGPAFYIERGIKSKAFALTFSIITIISCSLFLPSIQSNSISISIQHAFDIPQWITGIFICIFLALTVFGGAKKIGRIAQVIVPFMAVAYIAMAIVIIGINIQEVPHIFGLIFRSAFNMEATFGGVFGAAIAMGVKRGIYSNEAGQGTAPHAAAASETSHPVKQGLVQAFSVYIDTLFVCTATALMILFTNQYNVADGMGGFIIENIPGVEPGSEYTVNAIATQFPLFASKFVAIALTFFAITTTMSYIFIAESNFEYLSKKKNLVLRWAMRLIILVFVYYASISEPSKAWDIGDIGVGAMAWINIIAILLLYKPALRALNDYIKQRKEGKDPIFDPKEIGIENASEVWDKVIKEREWQEKQKLRE
ncbi:MULTISPECIES: alanine/glycine:cation symporter family protein [Myroides]|uniref:Amino acid carrier protein n=1 Tax=Myroides albus TaxID=2562892 RepID=A0A6I3LLL9_9FLAO|nr:MULTISPECIES: alanine/glycine:cation symporter family protein [Myroides]MTG97082.1 amino acid carrier protein [Myroides albus]MVX34797.1 amino acid carrier protein [Myroides sp. LoEW2-1]UVD78495.1 alanine:cation symporter family protein [Myroides albus]